MAHELLNKARVEFFKVKQEYTDIVYIIPNTTVDGTDTITFTSNWSKASVQGGTQPLVAFDNVENPQLQINLKFNEELCREFNTVCTSYQTIINGFAKLQYPISNGGKIKQPYCRISWDGKIYRGFFTNVRITTSGPYRLMNGKVQKYRSQCEISAQFTVSPTNILTQENVNVFGQLT